MNEEQTIRSYQAPAKVNLSLLVHPPGPDGYHPLESLVQTVEWCDLLTVEPSEDFSFNSTIDLGDDNLVLRAWEAVSAVHTLPPATLRLEKDLPVGAGLGGGSSDAAAGLIAAGRHGGISRGEVEELAPDIGADVSLFLTGGTMLMTGRGQVVHPQPSLHDFAVAIVVPEYELSTADVYRRWDELEGPVGETVAGDRLPPGLRGGMPIRNDLLPAALSIEPRLGDFMADVRALWDAPVILTGSGSGCFGLFARLDEAANAAKAVAEARVGRGVQLRGAGVTEVNRT